MVPFLAHPVVQCVNSKLADRSMCLHACVLFVYFFLSVVYICHSVCGFCRIYRRIKVVINRLLVKLFQATNMAMDIIKYGPF